MKQVDFLTAEMSAMKKRYEKELSDLKIENQQLHKENVSLNNAYMSAKNINL